MSVADIYARSREMVFSPDEIHNLDPIIRFFTTGDYTSSSQGDFPFDPVLSAGILATWINGLVFISGGSLFTARLLSGLAHLAAAVGVGAALLRMAGLRLLDAAVMAASVWVAMIRVGSHDLRIINGGELWGFLYLAAGLCFVRRSPALAALFWGLSAWLVKTIYLPFAGAFLLALIITETRGRGFRLSPAQLVRTAAPLVSSFLLPLLVWMGVIWLRYDTSTLAHWCFSYVTFVAKHAAAVSLHGLPTYSGWAFDPAWNSQPFRTWGWERQKSYVNPLVLAAVPLGAHTILRLVGIVRPSPRESAFIAATIIAVGFELVWFFAFDPTQWGRHLIPAIYVAVALAVYCVADIWRNTATTRSRRSAWALAVYAAVAVVTVASIRTVSSYVELTSWRASYAKGCRGLNVLFSPCSENDGLALLPIWARELCNTEKDPFDPTENCMTDQRARFLARAVETLEDPNLSFKDVNAAAYTIVVVQKYNYHRQSTGERNERDFLEDFTPLVCGKEGSLLYRRLRDGGMDMTRLGDACRERSL